MWAGQAPQQITPSTGQWVHQRLALTTPYTSILYGVPSIISLCLDFKRDATLYLQIWDVIMTEVVICAHSSGVNSIRVLSRPVAWLVVTMETVGQTNQPCVTTGSPPYLTIRSC